MSASAAEPIAAAIAIRVETAASAAETTPAPRRRYIPRGVSKTAQSAWPQRFRALEEKRIHAKESCEEEFRGPHTKKELN